MNHVITVSISLTTAICIQTAYCLSGLAAGPTGPIMRRQAVENKQIDERPLYIEKNSNRAIYRPSNNPTSIEQTKNGLTTSPSPTSMPGIR